MRLLKQFLYGAFYLAIIGLIGWGIYLRYVKPAPSCHDGIQDQGELGIDCGGPCGNICTAGLQPITSSGAWIFSNGDGHATLLASIANPNPGAGATSFGYSFDVTDASGTDLGTLPGASSVYPSQVRYIVLPDQAIPDSAAAVSLSIPTSTTSWVASTTMGSTPVFTFQGLSTSLTSSTVVAAGTLTNQQSSAILHVVVDAVFKNSSGTPVGASMTQLDNVAAFGGVPFSISYPANPAIDLSETEVEAYVAQ